MKMKKIFSSVMALGLATTLAACGGETNQPADNTADTTSEDTAVDTADEAADNEEDAAEDTADTAEDADAEETDETEDAEEDTDADASEDENALSAEDQADLESFDNVTADDTLVVGSNPISGDFLVGWQNNAYDVKVRKFLGIEGNNGFSTMVVNENGEYENNTTVLAEEPKVEENEDGSRTVTFKIKDDLKWSDGEPVTIDDYLFDILIFSHPSLAEVTASTAEGADKLVGYEAYRAGDTPELSGVERIDDTSFKVTIDAKNLPYFEEGWLLTYSPFPMHAVSENLAINEAGNQLVVAEGYEVTEEDTKAYKDGLQAQIDQAKADFEENNSAPADDATDEEKEEYAAAEEAYKAQVADLEQRRDGEVDPTNLLIEGAMLNIANEYRIAPSVTPGPYKFDSFENNMVKMSLNEYYPGNFRGDKATIPHIIIQVVNANISVDLLENGDIDVWETEATGGRIDQMKAAAEDGKITVNSFERNGYGNVTFLTDRGATQYKEVRQAIAHLMDRNTFVQQFAGGYGVVTNGMYGTSQWMYQERGADLEDGKLTNYQLNIDTANELLDASPYKYEADGTTPWDKAKADEAFANDPDGYDYWRFDENGKQLVVNQFGSDESEITTLISNQLPNNAKQVGMEYNVTAGSFTTLLNYYYTPEEDAEYTVFNMGTNFDTPFDPWYSYNSEGPHNYTKTNDPAVDDITVRLRQTDPADREGFLDTWEEFQVWYNDYLPEIPLYSNVYHTGYTNRVQGFDINTPVWELADQINAVTLAN